MCTMNSKKLRTIIKPFTINLFILTSVLISETESKNQYVQPLNMGMQVAIPYDIANIFNRPVYLSRPIGLFLSFSFLSILFFGVITSPFGYILGIPSEKYVFGQTWGSLSGSDASASKVEPSRNEYISEFDTDWVDKTNYEYGEAQNRGDYVNEPRTMSSSYSGDFMESMFYWMPSVQHNECRKLVLCYGHRVFHNVPDVIFTVYRFFSKRLRSVDDDFKEAIYTGLEANEDDEEFVPCEDHFPDCPETAVAILVRSAVRLMPKWTRTKALNRNEYF